MLTACGVATSFWRRLSFLLCVVLYLVLMPAVNGLELVLFLQHVNMSLETFGFVFTLVYVGFIVFGMR